MKIGSLCWRFTSNKPKKTLAQTNVFEGMRSWQNSTRRFKWPFRIQCRIWICLSQNATTGGYVHMPWTTALDLKRKSIAIYSFLWVHLYIDCRRITSKMLKFNFTQQLSLITLVTSNSAEIFTFEYSKWPRLKDWEEISKKKKNNRAGSVSRISYTNSYIVIMK